MRILWLPLDLIRTYTPFSILDEIDLLLVRSAPEVQISEEKTIVHMFFPFGDEPVFPDISLIDAILYIRELVEKGISYTNIIEVYFLHFRDFFSFIAIEWGKSVDDIALLEEVDIAFHCTTIHAELSPEARERDLRSDLEGEELQEFREDARIFHFLKLEDIPIESG